MAAADDLINKGFIVNRQSDERGRTFIVTGPHRSGTSLVASILWQAGLFIGSEVNDIVFEDEAITRVLASRDLVALRHIIAERNARHPCWGFKIPMLCRALDVGQLTMFDRPRLIVTFRDPVAMAVRTSISEFQDPMRVLHDVPSDQAAMMAFVHQLPCPNLLLSYEKALIFPGDFVDSIMQFCDIPRNPALHARLIGLIELNRQRYLAGARRRYEGVIEGVRGEHLYGWCRLTQSNEPVRLDVLVDDRAVSHPVADTFRQDLPDAGIGKGSHGFFVRLETLQARPDSVIRVKVTHYGIELDNSGTRLCDFASSA
jgi:hypothetical protein